MILLRELLLEMSRAPIYHATGIIPAVNIVLTNTLADTTLEWDSSATFGSSELIPVMKSGPISFTRDKRYLVRGRESNVVFELDTDKLRQRYKMKPRVGRDLGADEPQQLKRSEAEESVRGPIKPLDKYLIAIYVDAAGMKSVKNSIVAEKKHYEWSKGKNNQKGMDSAKKRIQKYTKFLSHPKLKVGKP